MTRTYPATTSGRSPFFLARQHWMLLALIGIATTLILVIGQALPAQAANKTLGNGYSCPNGFTVPAGDTWTFDPNANTTITCGGNVIVQGTLVMKPANGNITHRLVFSGFSTNFVGGGMDVVAQDVGLWVMGSGRIILQGEQKPAWAYAWQSSWTGDEVVAAPNTPNNYTGFRTVTSTPAKNALGYSTELLNLTRNVRVEGTNAAKTHVFIRSTRPSTIKNAAFRYMAPAPGLYSNSSEEATGRYGLHIHMSHDGSRGTIVDGLVIRDTDNHAFVPHLSNGITFKNTIAYNVKGEAYWWDDGDTSHDIVFDRAVAAKVDYVNGGENHRLSAFFLGIGNRVTVTNSVVVGMLNDEGGADRAGYLWPEDAEATWNFLNNRAHNNETNGIFVWQNNEMRHIIDGFIAYYNADAGIEHGAYTNSYVYKNLTLLGNGTAIHSHAMGEPGDGGYTDTQIWANVKTNGGTLYIDEHAREAERPVRFVDCDLGRVDVNDSGGAEPSRYDFIRCGLEPNDFDLSGAQDASVFRVQRANGTAYELRGNGAVRSIPAFYSGTVPGTPGLPGAAPGEFTDTANSVFKDAIDWLYDQGITQGCNPPANNRFCPDDRVTRGQMATFLARAQRLAATNRDYFNDDEGNVFEGAINRLRAAGITQGCNPPANNRFCPDRNVTRGEMAAFLVRAFDLPAYSGRDRFRDDNDHIFESAIERLAQAGITVGCNPPANDRFCPNDYVTRGQMAAFLKRALTGASADAGSSVLLARAETPAPALAGTGRNVEPVARNEESATETIWCSMAS